MRSLCASTAQVADDMRSLRAEICSCLADIDNCVQHTPNPSPVLKPSPAPPDCKSNIIIYGIPETKDISIVSDVLEAAAGGRIAVKDMFRLGKRKPKPKNDYLSQTPTAHNTDSTKPHRPVCRPILVKLSCPWDWRLILAGKVKLSNMMDMKDYFIQPDLSFDECKKRKDAYLARKSGHLESSLPQ